MRTGSGKRPARACTGNGAHGSRPRLAITARAWSSSSAGGGTEWQPALAGGETEGPAGRFGRERVRDGSRWTRSRRTPMSRAFMAWAPSSVALGQAATISASLVARPSATATLTAPTAPTARSGKRERVVAAVDLEPVGSLRHEPGRSRRGSPVASFTPTMFGTSRARREHGVALDLASGPHRDVVEHDREPGRCRPRRAKCGRDARLRRSRVVGGHHEDGRPRRPRRHSLVHSMVCRVSLEPVPAMTGTVTASATARHSSAELGVGEHRAFSRGARHDQAVAAVAREPAGQGDGSVDVERSVARRRA